MIRLIFFIVNHVNTSNDDKYVGPELNSSPQDVRRALLLGDFA